MTQVSLLTMKCTLEPAQFAQFMQDKGDIFWWEPGKFWVITSHDYAKQILTSDDFTCDRSSFFISRMPNMDLSLIQDFFAVVSKMMVMSDAPQHTARRRICYDGFTTQTLQNLEPLIKAKIAKQLDQSLTKGQIEIVENLAKIIPSTVLAEFFHIPEQERPAFYEWSNNMTQFFGGASQYRNEDGIEVNQSAANLKHYFTGLIKKRREQPEDDFLSILLKNQQHFGLADEEIVSQAIMMLVAGQVTTTDQLCNNLYTLMTKPGALEILQRKEADLDDALDELNRLDPAVTFTFRVTKQDTFIGEQAIKAGDVIFISNHAVNRDPRVFTEPNQCILTRPNNRHLSYGFGGHYCLGAKLARIEMRYCLAGLLERFPDLHLMPDAVPKRKHHSLAFSGFEHLHLGFTPVL